MSYTVTATTSSVASGTAPAVTASAGTSSVVNTTATTPFAWPLNNDLSIVNKAIRNTGDKDGDWSGTMWMEKVPVPQRMGWTDQSQWQNFRTAFQPNGYVDGNYMNTNISLMRSYRNSIDGWYGAIQMAPRINLPGRDLAQNVVWGPMATVYGFGMPQDKTGVILHMRLPSIEMAVRAVRNFYGIMYFPQDYWEGPDVWPVNIVNNAQATGAMPAGIFDEFFVLRDPNITDGFPYILGRWPLSKRSSLLYSMAPNGPYEMTMIRPLNANKAIHWPWLSGSGLREPDYNDDWPHMWNQQVLCTMDDADQAVFDAGAATPLPSGLVSFDDPLKAAFEAGTLTLGQATTLCRRQLGCAGVQIDTSTAPMKAKLIYELGASTPANHLPTIRRRCLPPGPVTDDVVSARLGACTPDKPCDYFSDVVQRYAYAKGVSWAGAEYAVLNNTNNTRLGDTKYAGPLAAMRACNTTPECAGTWRAGATTQETQLVLIDGNVADYLNAVNASSQGTAGAGIFMRRTSPLVEAPVRDRYQSNMVIGTVRGHSGLTGMHKNLDDDVKAAAATLGAFTFGTTNVALPAIGIPGGAQIDNYDITAERLRARYDPSYTSLAERGRAVVQAYQSQRALAGLATREALRRKYQGAT